MIKEKTFLLDTTALLAHYRKEKGFDKVHALFENDATIILISTLSIAEFARRMVSLGEERDSARQKALDYASLADELIPVDTAVSIRAFELGTLAADRLPLIDSLIGASASLHGAVLVHRDLHFASLSQELVPQLLLV